MQPLYLVCVFWGAKYRDFFLRHCLPSLLAPGNLPLLQSRPGSKLIVATSQDDWAAIADLPMLDQTRAFAEVAFIDIGYPKDKSNAELYLHMTKGHKLAARMMAADRAYGSFLAPDLLLTDGTIRRVLELIDSGKKAVFAPALRFQTEATMTALKQRGLLKPEAPLAFPASLAGEIASACLHSELLRFEWTAPHFCDYPISIFRRVGNSGDMVAQTSSWAIIAASYAEIADYKDDYLDQETVDCHYIDRTFFTHLRKDQIHMVQDSDEMVFFSLTAESDLTFFPLKGRRINRVPFFGEASRLRNLRRFVQSDVMDEFRRWAYSLPCHFHSGPLRSKAKVVAGKTTDAVRQTLGPLNRRERIVVGLERGVVSLRREVPAALIRGIQASRAAAARRACVLYSLWAHRQTIAIRVYQVVGGDRSARQRVRRRLRQVAREMLGSRFKEQEPQS